MLSLNKCSLVEIAQYLESAEQFPFWSASPLCSVSPNYIKYCLNQDRITCINNSTYLAKRKPMLLVIVLNIIENTCMFPCIKADTNIQSTIIILIKRQYFALNFRITKIRTLYTISYQVFNAHSALSTPKEF